jgi:hypothetical protein
VATVRSLFYAVLISGLVVMNVGLICVAGGYKVSPFLYSVADFLKGTQTEQTIPAYKPPTRLPIPGGRNIGISEQLDLSSYGTSKREW